MRSSPFARAILLMQALAAAAVGSPERMIAIRAAQGYQSRGHGRGERSGRKQWRHACTNWKAHMNSEREVARRLRQIQKGILRVN